MPRSRHSRKTQKRSSRRRVASRKSSKRLSRRRRQKGGQGSGMYKGIGLPDDIAKILEKHNEKNPDGTFMHRIEVLEEDVKKMMAPTIKDFRKDIRFREPGDVYTYAGTLIIGIMGRINGLKALEKYYNDRTGNQKFNMGEYLENVGKYDAIVGREKITNFLNRRHRKLLPELEDENYKYYIRAVPTHGIVDPENVLKVRQQFMVNLKELYPGNELSNALENLETEGKITHDKEQFIAKVEKGETLFKPVDQQGGRRNRK